MHLCFDKFLRHLHFLFFLFAVLSNRSPPVIQVKQRYKSKCSTQCHLRNRIKHVRYRRHSGGEIAQHPSFKGQVNVKCWVLCKGSYPGPQTLHPTQAGPQGRKPTAGRWWSAVWVGLVQGGPATHRGYMGGASAGGSPSSACKPAWAHGPKIY